MVRKYITRDFTEHQRTVEYLSDEDEYIKFEVFSFDPEYTQRYTVSNGTLVGENANVVSFKSLTCLQSADKVNPLEFTLNYTVKTNGTYRIDVLYEKSSKMYTDTMYNTSKDLVGWCDIYTAGSKSEHTAKITTAKYTPQPVLKGDKIDSSIKKSLEKFFKELGILHQLTDDEKKNNKILQKALEEANNSNVDSPETAIPLKFEGENNALKRKTIFYDFNTGDYKLEFGVPHNCYVVGVLIRKQITFTGTNNDEAGTSLQFTDGKLTISDMTKPSELEVSVGYDSSFECPTSPSGLYLEYMDECNLYIKDSEGNPIRKFGGYISTPLPDNSMEEITIHCADRLKDGENRYILDQLLMQYGDIAPSETDYDLENCISFDKHYQALSYLCRMYEDTLENNIEDAFVETEKYQDKGFQVSFGKKKDVKKITVTNGQYEVHDNNITLRNNDDGRKKQVFTLWQTKKPVDITDYNNFHIVCGLGDVKTEYKKKETSNVDTADTTAGSQGFGKCGVSDDKKYVMGIGQRSSGRDPKGYGYGSLWEGIYENKCPACGHNTLRWDSCRSDTKCIYTENWKGTKGSWHGGIPETEITCNHCDCDFSVLGVEKASPWRKLKRVGSIKKSSKSRQNKLHNGEMTALAKSNVKVSPENIFKAIKKACKGWTHRTGTGTTASYLEKHHVGDCWAWSDWIGKQLKKYKVNYKIVQYATSQSPNGTHRSVLYQAANGKYVDFPYSQYNFPSGTHNTSGSKSGKVIASDTTGGRISQATVTGSTQKKQTTEKTITKGYDKDAPFRAYVDICYSISKSKNAKKYHFYLDFTEKSTSNDSWTGLKPVWVNNTTKDIGANGFMDHLKSTHNASKVYLHSISLIAPKIKVSSDDDKKTVTWYTNDNAIEDNSSCKMILTSIAINNINATEPSDMGACGKTINEVMANVVQEAGYTVQMDYGLHRCDDKINFIINTTDKPVFYATEGDNNNILEWGNISYNPANELFNSSKCVFKIRKNEKYRYVETTDVDSILQYKEQCTLLTENESIGEKEAYWNARHNDKYNPEQQYTFTITVKGSPDVRLGDYVSVTANMKKLNTLKEVKSITLVYNSSDKPVLQTELGLGELAPDIQVTQNIKALRDNAKKSSTAFSTSALPITDENIYEWEQ